MPFRARFGTSAAPSTRAESPTGPRVSPPWGYTEGHSASVTTASFSDPQPRFFPWASNTVEHSSASGKAESAAARVPTAAAATGAPAGGAAPVDRKDLIARSAFLYGLRQSEHLLFDVQAAIREVNRTASEAGDAGGEGKRKPVVRPGSALCGVFYFTADPPMPDMPWRPRYKSAVLLCVFASAELCQQTIAHKPTDGSSGLSFVPASAFELSAESTSMALLTFLRAPQLASVLLHRRRTKAALERDASDRRTSSGVFAGPEQMEDMLAYVRANPPAGWLCGAPTRLFAAILSRYSPYTVDWAEAQTSVNRHDGVVVQELSVMEPWVGTCMVDQRGDGLRDHERRTTADGASAAGREKAGSMAGQQRGGDSRASWSSRPPVPLTLQEEEYRRRYGTGDGGEASSNLGWTGRYLYSGGRQLARGVTWVLRQVRNSLSEGEAPLLTTSRDGVAGFGGALNVPPTPSRSAATANAAVQQAESSVHSEPPRARRRVEGDTASGQCSLVIPRYNAVGSALTWMPGFQCISPLFRTGTTVLTPTGAAPRAPRRRPREEESSSLWAAPPEPRHCDPTPAQVASASGSGWAPHPPLTSLAAPQSTQHHASYHSFGGARHEPLPQPLPFVPPQRNAVAPASSDFLARPPMSALAAPSVEPLDYAAPQPILRSAVRRPAPSYSADASVIESKRRKPRIEVLGFKSMRASAEEGANGANDATAPRRSDRTVNFVLPDDK